MKRWPVISSLAAIILAATFAAAQQPTPPTQLTIYNDDFAVARTSVPLDLHEGVNQVLTTSVTSQLEPDSVILRDPTGHHTLHVLEQNYDAGVVTQSWLLQKYEGKTIDFQVRAAYTGVTDSGQVKAVPAEIVPARIVRAGNNPLIEVNGHLQFQLPGLPLFPSSTDGLLLKPTLRWQIAAQHAEQFPAELDYITHGLSWQAAYNVVVPEAANVTVNELAEVIGWVTIQNNSGTDFPSATIQLMAGDVAKIRNMGVMGGMGRGVGMVSAYAMAAPPAVTQKAFDDFHLYDLHRTVSLADGESKQVQFLDATGVTVKRTYEFQGNDSYENFYPGYHNDQRDFGLTGNTTVAIRQEIKNSDANHLGLPLPAGRLRLYRRETTGQMQFVGESMVPHTAADQSVHITSGKAFDLTGARRQTDFHVDTRAHTIDESFEIKLSNAKAEPVTIHDIENLNRGDNWDITAKSTDLVQSNSAAVTFAKRDSNTIDFPITVPAKGSTTLTYTVHYTW